jgi:hypothetical protein
MAGVGVLTVYHGTEPERAEAIISSGFVEATYHFSGSGTAVTGFHDGVFVAPNVERARQHGDVVIAIDIDGIVKFDRSGEALIPAADLNRYARRIEEARWRWPASEHRSVRFR